MSVQNGQHRKKLMSTFKFSQRTDGVCCLNSKEPSFHAAFSKA